MGNEYYDKDGYVYTKSNGGYEPKWDVWTQSQVREGHDLESQPSGYAPGGAPLYKGRDSSSGTSSEEGSDDFFAWIAFIFLVIIAIAVALVTYAIVAPIVSVVRKGMQTQDGKRQLRNFGITMLVASSLTVLSVTTLISLGGNYSNDWVRLFQFLITVMVWALIIHLAVKRNFWYLALESTRYFAREYFIEFTALIQRGGESLERRLS